MLLRKGVQNRRSRSTSMRFHPNSRASTDHAPGPMSAKAAPMVAMRMQAEGSLGRVAIMFHVASATASEPASGVHMPANRSIPIVIAETAKTEKWNDGPASSLSSPWITKQNPATSRISNRPAPGQPGANVENNRRKYPPNNHSGYLTEDCATKPQKGQQATISSH